MSYPLSLRPLPEDLEPVVQRLIERTRRSLETGVSVESFAVLGGRVAKNFIELPIDSRSHDAKAASVAHIRKVALLMNADFAVIVSNSWGLPPDKLKDARRILEECGSISNCPFKIDQMAFVLETQEGVWLGTAAVVKHPRKRRAKTFGKVKFIGRSHDEAAGTLTSLLPKRAAIVH